MRESYFADKVSVLLMVILSMILVLSAFSGRQPQMIINYEFIFISLYFIIERESILYRLFNNTLFINNIVKLLLIVWSAAVVLSFLLSPYDLYNSPAALLRLFETFMHMIMFFVVRDYLIKYKPNIQIIFTAIYLPVFIIGIVFLVSLYETNLPYSDYSWFLKPAFNLHIRHTGYLAAAAVSLTLILLYKPDRKAAIFYLNICSIGILSHLYWMGGRGTVLSVWICMLLVMIVLYFSKKDVVRYGFNLLLINLIALMISELLVVFQWNGLFNNIDRSVASTSVNTLSSGRLAIWQLVIDAMHGQYLLGLGSNAFDSLPTPGRAVHAHNMFFQFWLEWGVLGAVSFIMLIALGFLKGVSLHLREFVAARKVDKLRIEKLAAASLIAVLTLHGLTDGTYFHQQPLLYLVIAFAIWTAPAMQQNNHE